MKKKERNIAVWEKHWSAASSKHSKWGLATTQTWAMTWNGTSDTALWDDATSSCGKLITHSLLVGLQNDTATLENNLASSYYITQEITTWSDNRTLRYLSQGNENLASLKSMHFNVHSIFICKSKTEVSSDVPHTGEWLNKLWGIRTMKYYSTIKWNKLDINNNLGESHCQLKKSQFQTKSPHTVWFYL